jgi:hypothetical protein
VSHKCSSVAKHSIDIEQEWGRCCASSAICHNVFWWAPSRLGRDNQFHQPGMWLC